MRKVVEKTIGAHRYQVKQMGALTGGELIFRIGMPLVGLVAAKTLDGNAIRSLQKAIGIEDFKWAIEQFVACSKVLIVDEKGATNVRTGQKASNWIPLAHVYDEHFADDYMGWMQWLQFVAEVNFRDFFSGAASKEQEAPAASESSSQPTATGSPGAS